MEMKFLWGGALFLVGWLWSYLFIRQLMFNFLTAYPLIKKMRALQDELIATGANRYTTVSVVVNIIFAGLTLFLAIHFCKTYQLVCFIAGAVLAFVMLIPRTKPNFAPSFDIFCNGYYRFVPDDELRTAMYNKKLGEMKSRMKAMGISDTFIPEFKS